MANAGCSLVSCAPVSQSLGKTLTYFYTVIFSHDRSKDLKLCKNVELWNLLKLLELLSENYYCVNITIII